MIHPDNDVAPFIARCADRDRLSILFDKHKRAAGIKANAALYDIPIIALSAHAMTGDEERALQSGCNDYLSKPLDEDLLFAKLTKFLGQE